MKGISKDELIEVRKGLLSEGLNTDVIDALITLKVKELQEPWMTLEEFLKSEFEGLCWIALPNKFVFECHYHEGDFIARNGCVNYESVYRVMPIHKPEPPK